MFTWHNWALYKSITDKQVTRRAARIAQLQIRLHELNWVCELFQLLSYFDYRLHSTSSVECGPPVVTRIRLIAVLLHVAHDGVKWPTIAFIIGHSVCISIFIAVKWISGYSIQTTASPIVHPMFARWYIYKSVMDQIVEMDHLCKYRYSLQLLVITELSGDWLPTP